MEEGAVRNSGNDAYGDPEVLHSVGLGHLLVLFWTRSNLKTDNGREYYELAMDPNEYHIIGCDDDETTKLLHYRSHFLGSTIRSYLDDTTCNGVIDRIFKKYSPEMSPNISFYSQHEYPHLDFALSCGILSSFCFSFLGPNQLGVMEIVSTCNPDVETLGTFCKSINGFHWFSQTNVQKRLVPEIDYLLDVVSQTFWLPLTQYWNGARQPPSLVQQISYRARNLEWCQFEDACYHTCLDLGKGPFGSSCKEPGAFFCRDITALSITEYPFAHYARNCGSIACFTMYLRNISRPCEEWILEFFLPAQEMDNDYPQTLLNSIWATIKKCLTNWDLASGEQLGQMISVKVIKSSSRNEPEYFKIGQHDSSLPPLESSEYTRTLNFFENNTGQRRNSYSCEEAGTGESSKRVPNEAFQPRTSEENFKTRGNTVAAERVDEPVEESTIEDTPCATSDVDVGCAASNIDIGNDVTTASQRFRFQTMKKTTQQEEETMILENEGDTSLQLPCIFQPLFECGTQQDEEVLGMKKSTPNMYLSEEIPTVTPSKRTPGDVEQIISLDELEECIEPQSLTSQPTRSKNIFRDEGYTVASDSERVTTTDKLVEVSPDEDLEYAKTNALKRLKISKTSFTLENICKHFGRPEKDAAESFCVSLSTFKRNCRLVGITRWQSGNRKLIDNETGQRNFSSDMPHVQDTPTVAHTDQELNNMDVKVMYHGVPIRFDIPTSSGITELENNVMERLPLNRKSFSIKYQDDEGDWVLIACDKDVQKCLEISRSLKKTPIKMLLDPPVT